jgi:hypothetical protein
MHLTKFEQAIYLTTLGAAVGQLLNRGRVKRAEVSHRAHEFARDQVSEWRIEQRIARARRVRR